MAEPTFHGEAQDIPDEEDGVADSIWVSLYHALAANGEEYLALEVEDDDHGDPHIELESLRRVVIEPKDSGMVCAICLEEYSVGMEVRAMDCSHKFHEKCIFEWLGRTNSCPMCRSQMPKGSS